MSEQHRINLGRHDAGLDVKNHCVLPGNRCALWYFSILMPASSCLLLTRTRKCDWFSLVAYGIRYQAHFKDHRYIDMFLTYFIRQITYITCITKKCDDFSIN